MEHGVDILVTLSRDKRYFAGSIEKERSKLKEYGGSSWPLQGKRLGRILGQWIYFVCDGKLGGRAEITGITRSPKVRESVGGKKLKADQWLQYKPPLYLAKKVINQKGFRGYRFLSSSESKLFNTAFSAIVKAPKNADIPYSEDVYLEGKRFLTTHKSVERNVNWGRVLTCDIQKLKVQ